MAPVTDSEATAQKRKNHDEHAKRKRSKQHRSESKLAATNGGLSHHNVNGLGQSSDHGEKMALDIVGTDVQVTPRQRKEKKSSKRRHTTDDDTRTWRVSRPMGGRILDIDPILTADEKHLILAYHTSIQVYSATESLLFRQIQLPIASKHHQIVSVCQSPTSPELVWVASSSGRIWKLDWTNGSGSDVFLEVKCDFLNDMFIDAMKFAQKARDTLLVSVERDGKFHIQACEVKGMKLRACKDLYSSASIIENVRSVQNGRVLAASAEQTIILGVLRSEDIASQDQLDYEFFTFDTSDDVTCLDIRATERIHLNRKSQREASDMPVVDLVVGCARGPVLFYNDLLPQVQWLHSSKNRRYTLQPRKYHWHRKAVHAVKWSRDGNYIISGGSESTLVLWQLDTQKMDFLPHLSATIENIVVSTRGSSYVLHLNDNSTIILSTAEMKPTAYVSGVQTLLSPQPYSKDEAVRRIGQYPTTRLSKTPAAVNPLDRSKILLCVGNGQQTSHSGSGPSTPLIQTLDLTTMQSISKQALTRTNPTDVNTNAKGYAITEPRITGMAYSQDGRWLATTDEWQPPSRDVDVLDGSSSDRREVYLKFWSVPEPERENDSTKDQGAEPNTDQGNGSRSAAPRDLELMSRINSPHHTSQSESVFDVAADPKTERFATIGGDGVVRLWQPIVRQRNGVLIKGKGGHQLYNWTCSQVIYLHGNEAAGDLDDKPAPVRGSGAVSFSEDGSTLVCAIVHEHGSAVHIIDTESGDICNSVSGLINGDVQGIRVLSSYLIVLSDTLMVYDIVLDELRYAVQLRTNEDTHGPGAAVLSYLAVDYQTSRFAVAVTRSKVGPGGSRSELAVFNTEQCLPEKVQRFDYPITSLVASVGSSGFLVLDSAAQLWSVSESMDTKSLAFAQPLADLNLDHEQAAKTSDETTAVALLTEGDDGSASEDEMDVDMADDGTGGDDVYPAVVAPQRLAELFDTAPSFAMPPIEDMFYQVTKLFSTKVAVAAA
ncbi:Uu.00g028310.m01.CDS01 [Anthostomella pinea]|uniref:Uu.00g028310.m01.CDS01 n=1 Tax=Anthostomella pinea TaxID=933095 RepID=A0AAI8V7Y4_9PEZI|nr:Uu.00g028310.m01.CDS01 [Anthostomella pinea]